MQGSKALEGITEKLAKKDPFVFAEPINVVKANGKTFILDGHHRIEAAIRMGYEGMIPYRSVPANQVHLYSNGFKSLEEILSVYGH